MNHKGSPFPQVAEKIEEELEDYRSKEEDIKRMKSDMGLEGGNENDAALGLLSDNTQVWFLKNSNFAIFPEFFFFQVFLFDVFSRIFLVFLISAIFIANFCWFFVTEAHICGELTSCPFGEKAPHWHAY